MFRNFFKSNPWNEEQVAKWEKQRAKGKWRFVLRESLFYGTFMMTIRFLIAHFFAKRGFGWADLWIEIFVWYLAGLIWGQWIWARAESEYRESLNRNEHQEKENS